MDFISLNRQIILQFLVQIKLIVGIVQEQVVVLVNLINPLVILLIKDLIHPVVWLDIILGVVALG